MIRNNNSLINFYAILLAFSVIIASMSIPLTQYLGKEGKHEDYFKYVTYIVLMFTIPSLLFICGV
jgi:hypothetical protein